MKLRKNKKHPPKNQLKAWRMKRRLAWKFKQRKLKLGRIEE
jgi:hypothetical protein